VGTTVAVEAASTDAAGVEVTGREAGVVAAVALPAREVAVGAPRALACVTAAVVWLD
jgi:hypothetical protein